VFPFHSSSEKGAFCVVVSGLISSMVLSLHNLSLFYDLGSFLQHAVMHVIISKINLFSVTTSFFNQFLASISPFSSHSKTFREKSAIHLPQQLL
jgi:Na+(H+)/acetate symporter ActP